MDPSSGHPLETGRTLGHYRLLERIGAGGMGEVWRARDERLERDVALKVLLPGTIADEAARKRFRREALALSKLSHPGIATIFDFDSEDGHDFLVMEYVGGTTIGARRGEGPHPEPEVVRLGLQLAEGLAAAHAEGIVHRDLKPANVRLTADGRLKILDFGLAHLARPAGVGADAAAPTQSVSMTEPGALVGTFGYMAPEQVRGEKADARVDLWAAGLVLYELATGRTAYAHTETAPLLYAILNESVVLPRKANPHLSGALEAIILKCVEKEPAKRYGTARELVADLQRLQGGLSVAAERARTHTQRLRALAAVGPIAALLVLGALTALNVGGLRTRLFAPAPIRSIAVLPLANLSGDPEQEYFADGMTEQLINDLGQVGSLRIISRTSTMQYKNTKKGLPQIAKELHVDAIVEGSVVRSGDRVKITAQLIRAEQDRQLWARTYERELRDVLVMQGEIAQAIVSAVKAVVTPEQATRLASAKQVDPVAYDLYLKGRQQISLFTRESLARAMKSMRSAIERDSTAEYAWVGLADACLGAANTSLEPESVLVPRAIDAARRAIELDPTYSTAHALLSEAHTFEWNWKEADLESRRALELNPNDARAYASRGGLLTNLGRYDEAAATFREGGRLVSRSDFWELSSLGWNLLWAREFAEALAIFEEARPLDPNHSVGWMHRGLALSMLERHREAVAECREAVRRSPDVDYVIACCGMVFSRAGARADAADALSRLRSLARAGYVEPINMAWFYMGTGPSDSALFWLERGVVEHTAQSCNIKAGLWPDSLRADPRFKQLVARMGLPPD